MDHAKHPVKGNPQQVSLNIHTPAPPVGDRPADFLDKPMLLRPTEFRTLDTALGTKLTLFCDVVVVTGKGKIVNLGNTPIFWKGVQAQVEDHIGEWVGGRLHKGTASNANAFVLLEPTPADLKAFESIADKLDAGPETPEDEEPF